MDTKSKKIFLWLTLALTLVTKVFSTCPVPETIIPCICTDRNKDVQIWCTHSDLQQVLKGVQKIGEFVRKPIDELIIENNYLPSLPGKIFQNVKIQRLMLRHNGLERVSETWLETQEKNLVEIFIVENEMKSIPADSLIKLQNLQALTIQSYSLRRIPPLINIPRLKYVNIQTKTLNSISGKTFANLPKLERLYIDGSLNLRKIEENTFYNLPILQKLEITDCGITDIHMRALSLLPALNLLSLSNNEISDASMIGRTIRDLPMLTLLDLSYNQIDKLNEGAFVDQTMLEILYLSHNNINIIHHGAFHRVPKLRVVDLNYNNIIRIHPESFLQQSSSGVEELNLIGNKIMHISEFRALLEALPRLRFLDMSENLLQEIPRGSLRGHPSLERLHLNSNNIKYIEGEAFVAMPALRELHLSKNSLGDMNEGPSYWNLPNLKGLDLSNNFFQRLQPKLLYNLPSLRRINLSNNKLIVIDPLTFIETPLLEFINISGNALVSIHPATFRNLPNLYELDASSNKLIEFVPGLPRGLEQLNLQRNQLTNFPVSPSPDLDLPSLRTLDVSNNGIQRIPYGSFKTLNNLRRLYMKRNGLRQIEVDMFGKLDRLEILELSNNQIITVHPKSFTQLVSLKQININRNIIETFDFMVFKDNTELSLVDISKNKLKSISPHITDVILKIDVLNISSNNLNEIPSNINGLKHLQILDASFNHIKTFDGNVVSNAQELKLIKLSFNKIIEIRKSSFKELQSLEVIDLESNKIEIIYSLAINNLPNLLSIYLGRNHIIDIPDRVFLNLPKLKTIELHGNRLQYISPHAFENTPLVQHLNVSNNQLKTLENSGITKLLSLEILDLSFNKLVKITSESFKFMEWLVELNLDNNLICHISGQPFDNMPRLKVLSLRYNKLTTVAESNFEKLRNNIAVLDIDGNPLTCNCGAIWLKSWLLESTSIGPKCADGTYVKSMPFSRIDCVHVPVQSDNLRYCMTHENEALLPNLATSQIYSSMDKINKYVTQEKNNLQINKVNTRPTPEESEYFYDEYVDYPFNETVIDDINANNLSKNNDKIQVGGAFLSNMNSNNTTSSTNAPNVPRSGFTFFGMPLPAIDVGNFLNTGRKVDSHEKRKMLQTNNFQSSVLKTPHFETGGFMPMIPATNGGFKPIRNPTMAVLDDKGDSIAKLEYMNYHNMDQSEKKIAAVEKLLPTKISHNNASHSKTKSEIHEIKSYLNNNNATKITYNKTKNVEEQKSNPSLLNKYHLMESNLTISHITEKENIITTDTSNDMSVHAWMESTTSIPYHATNQVTLKPKNIESQPTALSAVLIPSKDELERRQHNKHPATITKVNLPHYESSANDYTLVNNRAAKTHFSEMPITNSRTKNADDKDWYYKNYNNSNLEPYIAPDIQTSNSNTVSHKITIVYCLSLYYFVYESDVW